MNSTILIFYALDLREDMRYLADHMGSNIITSAQVVICVCWFFYILYFHKALCLCIRNSLCLVYRERS